MLAIIGGSGLTQIPDLVVERRQIVRTPYGEPSGALTFGRLGAREVVFVARHGYGHTLAPHEINYRANVWALKEKGAERVVAVCTVGGIAPGLAAGDLVVPDQIVDYTWGRRSTYYEGQGDVVHIDFTHPYCAETRALLLAAAKDAGVPAVDHGTYGATQGPRLETKAEIDRLERDGCDLVGMTGMPEAALARELGLPYASLAVVANPAAGRGASAQAVSLEEISRVLRGAMERVRRVLGLLVERHGHP
jgi:5'-methylthioinosine phosphorylase